MPNVQRVAFVGMERLCGTPHRLAPQNSLPLLTRQNRFTQTTMKAALLFLTGVVLGSLTGNAQSIEVAPGVIQLGTFQSPEVTESSGVIPSHRVRGAYWTHNDSGTPTL